MRNILLTLVAGLMPVLALAQAAPAAKPAAKAAATKPTAGKSAPSAKKLAPSAVKAVEELTPLEEDDPSIKLSEGDLEIGRKVHVGDFPCELGARVKILALKREGFFLVSTGKHRFRMHPVESRTGAVRLEDPKRGAMFLQLGNKSMLMSAKLGQRLADECQSDLQAAFAESMKGKPAVNLLEPPPVAAPAVPASAATAAAAAMPPATPLPAASAPAAATPALAPLEPAPPGTGSATAAPAAPAKTQ